MKTADFSAAIDLWKKPGLRRFGFFHSFGGGDEKTNENDAQKGANSETKDCAIDLNFQWGL